MIIQTNVAATASKLKTVIKIFVKQLILARDCNRYRVEQFASRQIQFELRDTLFLRVGR